MLVLLCENMYELITDLILLESLFWPLQSYFLWCRSILLLQTCEERGYMLTLGSTEGSAGNEN